MLPVSDSQTTKNAMYPDVGAVLLAGGLARRMGGQDKGLVELGGKPMASYALEVLLPIAGRCVVNANRNAQEYSRLTPAEVEVIADSREGHLGPLAGLSSAIDHLDTAYVLMCPCDSPFIQSGLITGMIEQALHDDADVVSAHDGVRMQPVFCLAHRRVKPVLDTFLDSGERKIDLWFPMLKFQAFDASAFTESFRNINTLEELAAAEEELGS